MKVILVLLLLFLSACSMLTPLATVTPPEAMTRTSVPILSQTPSLTVVFASETPPPTSTPTRAPTMTPEPSDFMDSAGVSMRFVPAGTFIMGSETSSDEEPIQQVSLDAFYIDKYEVTNDQYRVCVLQEVCRPPGLLAHFNDPYYANHPVVYIDWQMANIYCSWRGGRLPTEAEWEKAASWNETTKTKTIYPWGNTLSCTFANAVAEGSEPCVEDTTPVGSYPAGASSYGVYDMAGNVEEWTSSLYLPYPYDADDGREDPFASGDRTLRGGTSYSWSVTTTYRSSFRGNIGWEGIGFRCVRGAQLPGEKHGALNRIHP